MTNFTANRAKMDYFLQCLEEDNPNKGDWSAKQFVPTVFPTPLPKEAADEYKVIAADTIKVWTEYLKRTRDWRPSIDRRTRDQLREDGDDGKPEFTLDAKKKYSYQCRLFLHETEEIVSDHEGEKMHRPLNEKELMDMVASVMRVRFQCFFLLRISSDFFFLEILYLFFRRPIFQKNIFREL